MSFPKISVFLCFYPFYVHEKLNLNVRRKEYLNMVYQRKIFSCSAMYVTGFSIAASLFSQREIYIEDSISILRNVLEGTVYPLSEGRKRIH